MATYLIGVDLGSSNAKAALFDDEGRALADYSQDIRPHQPRPGVAEYDPPALYKATLTAIRELVQRSGINPREVAALTLDGMISGTLGIDREGEAVTPYTTTLDQRYAPYLNEAMRRCGDLIRQKNGTGHPTVGPKIMWIRAEMPDVYRRCHKFAIIGDYVLGKMAGLKGDEAFIDFTYLWATGLADSVHYRWSEELCEALEIPVEKLPRIVQPTDIIGRVTEEAARAAGLLAGTPIAAGAGDQMAGLVGAGVIERGMLADVAGTYPVFFMCADRFTPDMQNKMVEIIPSAIPGLWYPAVFIIGGGLSHSWFQQTFGYADEVEGRKEGKDAYAVLEEKAKGLPPGSEKVIFIPHLGGRACPLNTNFRGMWIGFSWAHRREHFYRAILEAIAYDLHLSYRAMRAAYPDVPVEKVYVYGGGANSPLWNQIKADVMGLPYVRLSRVDLSVLGDAIIAGKAVGLYDDMARTARRFVQETERVEPDPRRHEFYQAYVTFYGHLLQQATPSYDQLATLPEWEA